LGRGVNQAPDLHIYHPLPLRNSAPGMTTFTTPVGTSPGL
jgi:hypothetical protein